jgi:hypothetical protein
VDKICLHPQAQNLLFKYYRDLRLIFNDVLGHLEVDYLSIALINDKHQLFFLSSMPSIEQNLILKNLWQQDPCFQKAFFENETVLIWNHLYDDIEMNHYKLALPKLAFAISIPSQFQDFKVNYSFGLKTQDPLVHFNLLENPNTLQSMGKYCLSNMVKIVGDEMGMSQHAHLKLIFSND